MAHVRLITVGVEDLAVGTRFHQRMGWRRSSASVEGTVTFLRGGATVLGPVGRDDLAAEAGVHPGSGGGGAVALAMNVPDEVTVDGTSAVAARAGGTISRVAERTDWGGYWGYFADPDGHLWEAACNPGFELRSDGRLGLPDG